MNLEKLVRPNILAMKAYSSARDEFEVNNQVVLLDANENPFASDWNRYPDPYQRQLKKAIAALKGTKVENIFLGNGSDEAIDLIFRIFCEPGSDNIIITDPTYGMYEVSAAIQDIEVQKVPLTKAFELDSDKVLSVINENTKLIFLCNPNNPTANLLNEGEIKNVIENFKGIVVLDEAYIDFTNRESSIQWLNDYPNLIVLQTFSKAWGMAGMRLGMAFSNSKIIQLFNKVKAPYNMSILTQNKALELIENNKEKVKSNLQVLVHERARLIDALSKFSMVEHIYPTFTNFILVRFNNHSLVFKTLIEAGLIVRDRSKALNCENCLRITVGTPNENELLIDVLSKI
ncbi:histidinol-phosphate transaminase [Fulvivirga lutimaris]|uniref:histidinol-phosphate transaminase n=1 Tax=Fulvivirga lutimaris TaxID=1819566 RepID=UPI0012BC9A0E|nr:histidinol-phosphate transaminase [Fulvivirga lutimaris]MTI41572.1 histidinol-phosphate transaminase [Fulvivirga lutimaris]